MLIRPYKSTDFDSTCLLLRELQLHLANVDSEGDIACTPDFGPEELRGYIKDLDENDGALFVAESEETVVGFVQGIIWKHDDEENLRSHKDPTVDGWVGLLVVGAAHRSGGIGKILLSRIEEYFKGRGCSHCRIKVSAHNNLARSFYQKNDYAERDIEFRNALS